MVAVLAFIALEWACVLLSVAFYLNASLFLISGSYGPIRLYFVCLTGLYAQRLKFLKQANVESTIPLMKPSQHSADGYSMVHGAIFVQDLSDTDNEGEGPVKVHFEITGKGSDLELFRDI